MEKCEYCVEGFCEYYASYEEQLENEVEYACDGTEEEQKFCGILKEE
jgi:hypothetical protein